MASTLRIVLEAENKASASLQQVSRDIKGVDEAATGAKPGIDATAHSIGPGLKAAALIGGAALVGLGAALLKLGADFDSAYDSIVIGTGATGEALEGLKDDFRAVVSTVPTDFGKASQAIADLNTRTGLSGPPLQELTKAMLEFSRLTKTDVVSNVALATRVFGDWSIATGDQAETLDKLFRASQLTGASVNDLMTKIVQYGAPLRAMNFSFEESVAMLGKWEKEGVNTELVLGSLRIAMGNFARDNVPMRKGLEDTIKELQRLGPGAEATSLAMEIFGARAGPDMAAAILEGRFALGDLVASLEDSEGAISDTAKATMDFGEKLTILKNRALLAIEPLASAFFDLANVAIDNLALGLEIASTAVQGVLDMFSRLQPETRGVIFGLAGLAGVLLGLPILATAAAFAMGLLTTAIGAATVALGILLSPIALAIAAVALFAIAFTENWGGMRDAVAQADKDFEEHFHNIERNMGALEGEIASHTGAISSSLKSMTIATQESAEATAEMAKAAIEEAVAIVEAAKAKADAAQATADLEQKQHSAAAATASLVFAQASLTAASRELTVAQGALRSAMSDVVTVSRDYERAMSSIADIPLLGETAMSDQLFAMTIEAKKLELQLLSMGLAASAAMSPFSADMKAAETLINRLRLQILELGEAAIAAANPYTDAIREQERLLEDLQKQLEELEKQEKEREEGRKGLYRYEIEAGTNIDEERDRILAAIEEAKKRLAELQALSTAWTHPLIEQLEEARRQLEMLQLREQLEWTPQLDPRHDVEKRLEEIRLEMRKLQLQMDIEFEPAQRRIERLLNPIKEMSESQKLDLILEIKAITAKRLEDAVLAIKEAQANVGYWEKIRDVAEVWVDYLKKAEGSLGKILEFTKQISEYTPGPSGLGVGNILNFQGGGVVPGPLGAPQLAVVHGGEEIRSLTNAPDNREMTANFFGVQGATDVLDRWRSNPNTHEFVKRRRRF